jgi:hypothetical protein
VNIREGNKGTIRVDACARRVWFWNGKEKQARCWWAVCVIDEASGDTKLVSNAPANTPLEELVRKHAVRYWIERGFQDAKTSLGMTDYQARGWPAWHHHMAKIMLAMLFLLRERRVHLEEIELLSCQDIVDHRPEKTSHLPGRRGHGNHVRPIRSAALAHPMSRSENDFQGS